jgi:hypothetical protein
MPYRFAVLWELADDAQPVGVVVQRDHDVLVELPNEHGLPKRYDQPYRVLGPDMTEILYTPDREGYFEQVMVDLSRLYAVGNQDTVDRVDDGTVLELLQDHVLAPRTRRRRCDYSAGLAAGRVAQPLVLGREGEITPYAVGGPVAERRRAVTVA